MRFFIAALLCALSYAQTACTTVGNTVQEGAHPDGARDIHFVDTSLVFQTEGEITQWTYFSERDQTHVMIVFRGSGTSWSIVCMNTISGMGTGAVTYDVPFDQRCEVQAGDVIGWYHEGNGVLSYDNGGQTVLWNGAGGADYGVSDTINFAGSGARTYRVMATVCPAGTCVEVGNTVQEGTHPDGAADISFVDTAIVFPTAGTVSQWVYFSERDQQHVMQIYRENGGSYTLICQNVIPAGQGTGIVNYFVPTGEECAVEAGDYIGWYHEQNGVLSYDNGGQTVLYKYHGGVDYAVGSIVPFDQSTPRVYRMTAMLCTGTTTTTSRPLTLEDCTEESDPLPISSVSGDGSSLQGDTVSLRIDYAGYMELQSITFNGDGDSPLLDTWTVETSDLCQTGNSASHEFSYSELTEFAEITREGSSAEFGVVAAFKYYAESDLDGSVREIMFQKEITFIIDAPSTFVVSVESNVQPGESILYDIDSHGVFERSGVQYVFVEFRTFSTLDLSGECSAGSEYFTVDDSSCSTNGDPIPFTHDTEGSGSIQSWRVEAQNPNECIEGQHTERLEVDVPRSDGYVERIEFVVNLVDELGSECGIRLGEFAMDASVELRADGDFISAEDASSEIFYLGSVMFFRVTFDSPMLPTYVDLTSLVITQNGVEQCSAECKESVEFVCNSCDDNNQSAGAVYEFSLVLSSPVFNAGTGESTPTSFDLTFGLQYSERRRLAQVNSVNVPIKFSIRDFDCHLPNGLLSSVKTVDCGMGSFTKEMICSNQGWRDLSACSVAHPFVLGPITFRTFADFVTVAIVVLCIIGLVAMTSVFLLGSWGISKTYASVPLKDLA